MDCREAESNEAVAVVQLRQDGSWVSGEGLWRWEDGIDREAWRDAIHGVAKSQT